MTEVEPGLRSSLEGDQRGGGEGKGGDYEAWERGEDDEHLSLGLLQHDARLQQRPHGWWVDGGVAVQGGDAQQRCEGNRQRGRGKGEGKEDEKREKRQNRHGKCAHLAQRRPHP